MLILLFCIRFVLFSYLEFPTTPPLIYPFLQNLKVEKTCERLLGRFRGGMIKNGMTKDQVKLLLGSTYIDSGLRTGAIYIEIWQFFGPGCVVFFMPDNQGIMRVIEVSFLPFFE